MRKRGKIITEADGPVASAASVIFLGGGKREIRKLERALWFIAHG